MPATRSHRTSLRIEILVTARSNAQVSTESLEIDRGVGHADSGDQFQVRQPAD